jgi:hypothetical protein
MPQTREVEYTCPYCGQKFSITIHDSVNVKSDPDLRDVCVSGDIFRHECPHCHQAFLVQNNMLYSDPEHKFVLWVSENDPGFDLRKIAEPLVKNGYRLRRVSTVQEFTEKITILEDGLDDVAVELAKYDSFIEFIDNKKGRPEDITSIEYQHTLEGVMKINIRMDDKGTSFLIPYDLITEEKKVDADRLAVDDREFPHVNLDWVVSCYMKKDGEA